MIKLKYILKLTERRRENGEMRNSFYGSRIFLLVSVIDGEGTIDGNTIKKGSHFILPYEYGRFQMEGNVELIASTVV